RGSADQEGGVPTRREPPNQLSSLPSPVDAFHRPQAPAPPHVTTPHERAPREDGTGTTNHARNRLSRTFFRDTSCGHSRIPGRRSRAFIKPAQERTRAAR